MKTTLLAAASALLLLSGCTTFKEYDKESKKGRDESTSFFVVKKDGSKVTGSKMKLVSDNAGNPFVVELDDKGTGIEQVAAFQDKNAYYERTDKGNFAKRLRHGKIDLFYFDDKRVTGYHRGAGGSAMNETTNDDHFCFRKGTDKPKELTRKQIAEMLQDNPDAHAQFVRYWKPNDNYLPKGYALKNIIRVVELYNR